MATNSTQTLSQLLQLNGFIIHNYGYHVPNVLAIKPVTNTDELFSSTVSLFHKLGYFISVEDRQAIGRKLNSVVKIHKMNSGDIAIVDYTEQITEFQLLSDYLGATHITSFNFFVVGDLKLVLLKLSEFYLVDIANTLESVATTNKAGLKFEEITYYRLSNKNNLTLGIYCGSTSTELYLKGI